MKKARRGGENHIGLGDAIRWLRARDAAAWKARLDAATSSPDIDAQRARKIRADADIRELDRDERLRELVPAAEVEEHWCSMMESLREALMAVPGTAVQEGLIRADREQHLETLVRDALTIFGKDKATQARAAAEEAQ